MVLSGTFVKYRGRDYIKMGSHLFTIPETTRANIRNRKYKAQKKKTKKKRKNK